MDAAKDALTAHLVYVLAKPLGPLSGHTVTCGPVT